VDIDHELAKFRYHHKGNGGRKADWHSAFSSWLMVARDFRPPEKPKLHTFDALKAFRESM
jgi:hypothetical protein